MVGLRIEQYATSTEVLGTARSRRWREPANDGADLIRHDQYMLDALGLDGTEQLVYQALIRQPSASVDDLGDMTRLTPQQIHDALAALEKLDLVRPVPGPVVRYPPAPPDVALEALILRKEAELKLVRATALQLDDAYHRVLSTQHPTGLVEIVVGREAVHERGQRLIRAARREMCAFDRPPYLDDPLATNQNELDALAKGVNFRVVYDRATLDIPGWWSGHYRSVAVAGERARVAAGVPVKMYVVDGQIALVALQTKHHTIHASAIVRPSELLDALQSLFDTLWRQAVPLPQLPKLGAADPGPEDLPPAQAGPTPFEATLVSLLAAGLGDEAISRQTGLSYRTLQRRVRSLMDQLGAQTRFQAGLRAAHRGWVRPPSAD
ncbi:helix-turn-helix domain-containing protein [Micromonospora rubida]|uniref:helix-turn-helix domain-containing protein n=1 Tax=Micromonospora rubida TaxID=2697657 RepID=UPI0013786268|nr:helix-turn-helix domain-containing protein [Micromonospora rubida]NBE83303.1 transcriptional regulator TrmB [Micromonospora rubida]